MRMEFSCGLGYFHPKWLRNFATVKVFMAVYGLLGTIQAMAFVYLVVTLSTMEKRFKISSQTTGIILSGNEISQILLSLILSYTGAHRNRPRWIAWGVAFSALSCFVAAMPHFIYGPGADALSLTINRNQPLAYAYTNLTEVNASYEDELLCNRKEQVRKCSIRENTGDFSIIPLFLVFLSQFIFGIGNTLYFSLGQTYLDDNTKKTKTPMLLAWVLALRTLGPAVGFILAYGCLNIYIDPMKTPVIDKKDPRWLGAWWLGWILLGSIMFVFSFLIALFPQNLPGIFSARNSESSGERQEPEQQHRRKETLPSQTTRSVEIELQSAEAKKEEIPKFRDFPATLLRLLKNKLLMCNNFSAIFYILASSGYITYISKYLEVQFQDAATYTVITGPSMLAGMIVGFLLSGYLISIYKPMPVYLLSWNVLVGWTMMASGFILMQLDCPIRSKLPNFSLQLNASCIESCECKNSTVYVPVCNIETRETIYTRCGAHCESDLSDVLYDNGPCRTDCSKYFLWFVVVSVIVNFLGSSARISNILVSYRSVDVREKSFAQGLALWMISVFALIPGPIIYGIIIDSTCMLWSNYCGKRGNCFLYDRRKMRIYVNSTAIILTAVGVAFDCVVCYLAKTINIYEINTN